MSFLKLSLMLLILRVGMSSMAQVESPLDRPRVVIDAVELEGAAHLPETVKEQLVDSLQLHEYEETFDWIRDVEDRCFAQRVTVGPTEKTKAI